ncbi:microtubule-associated protein RP/EB family member 3 isoform X2 [Octopus bimaculoides]|uniref:Calponin-homology (CH) domain-containing protein n=1 Tax=Octopus bimaculoides TaxID=37653 RepID=A0A0L8FYJ8_OCTBM|nr:microtubule-associated protein RP/EB family member 3 isoform X2 [Octopus bimaculoides]|eukprot:XP_014785751.1 PREDICTED: microtubule-associated protein RP/EB family member 3-like isoform X2 [Octopus bimaculoides]
MEMQVVTNTQSQGIHNISKETLINWLQETLCPEMKDIGELGSGTDLCLGMEILFPGSLSLRKVRIGGLTDYDKYHNFKCLQCIFNELGIIKNIPMENMMRMTFKDNFYFGRWFKLFFEANYVGQPYSISKLRSKCQVRNFVDIGNKSNRKLGNIHDRTIGRLKLPMALTMKLRTDITGSRKLQMEKRKLHQRIIEKYHMDSKCPSLLLTRQPSRNSLIKPLLDLNPSESLNIIEENMKKPVSSRSASKSYQALPGASPFKKERKRNKKGSASLSVSAIETQSRSPQCETSKSPTLKDGTRTAQTGDMGLTPAQKGALKQLTFHDTPDF